MIELRNLSKRYGKAAALEDFSVTVQEPGIYCLLGRNGAGKTTLMKLLAGHIAATEGAALVNGRAVDTLAMPEEVFYVESAAAQFNVRLDELIRYAAVVNPAFDAPFAVELARRFKLDMNKRYKQLSFGM
jgi:ABC-2 type transport system ATP-binding protein